ncbi:family 16 glycoside hydrolase [Meredithblackwellia eburnea MCA 4105]
MSMASSWMSADEPMEKIEPDYSLLWRQENKEADDFLHEPDPDLERMLDRQCGSCFSFRGWLNVSLLTILIVVLIGLFGGWPIYKDCGRSPTGSGAPESSDLMGWNLGGINGSGQVPNTGLPNLIDSDTPQSAYTRTGFDGKTYNLVFSDEFNTDGRTFWPGDDPWWEAVDLHYWATTDLEWYDPDAITTSGGNLVITLSEEPIHDLNFRSGMLQSWNKFCFTGGYVEASMSLPGTPSAQGYWPGVWTMGNLGRAGYGATNHGMWPYSYDSCDVGTLPNQTYPNGTWPVAAKQSGDKDYGGELSYLPGQRASACTCPGEDHPGPSNNVGRGAPEIDIIEGQVDYRLIGSASQSIQLAPMDAGYMWKNTTPYIEIWNTTGTFQSIWQGSVNQESLSVITLGDRTSYEGAGYTSYGYEYVPGPNGRITWAMNGTQTWQLNADAIGPNSDSMVAQRLISEEPMYINLNLAISTKFQYPEWGKLSFPGHLRIDYVRVYQTGDPNIGCDPSSHPTSDYIQRHLTAYSNPNYTVWTDVPGETWPKNSLSAAGCS